MSTTTPTTAPVIPGFHTTHLDGATPLHRFMPFVGQQVLITVHRTGGLVINEFIGTLELAAKYSETVGDGQRLVLQLTGSTGIIVNPVDTLSIAIPVGRREFTPYTGDRA